MSKKTIGNIEDETAILPHIIAAMIAGESATLVEKAGYAPEKVLVGLPDYLTNRAQESYKGSPDFRRKVRAAGNRGRDYVYSFMRHWAARYMLDKGFPRGDIPADFANGLAVK